MNAKISYAPLIKKLLRKKYPSHIDKDDLSQEAYLAALSGSSSLRIRGAIIDEVRRQNYSSRTHTNKIELREDLEIVCEDNPEKELQRKELRGQVMNLGPIETLVMLGYFYRDMTEKEIGELLDYHPSMVSLIKKRAVEKLKHSCHPN